MDDTKIRIMSAAMKAVRQYGLEGMRIQNVSDLAGISPGALYRYFESKDQLIIECFTYVDRQAAAIFEQLSFNPLTMLVDPIGAVKKLWLTISSGGYCHCWRYRPSWLRKSGMPLSVDTPAPPKKTMRLLWSTSCCNRSSWGANGASAIDLT